MVTISPRNGRWIVAGLLVSLAINVFLGGLVIGRMINAGPRGRALAELAERQAGGQAQLLNGPILRLAQSLPEEHRPAFVRAIEAHRGALQATNQGVRDARQKLSEATVTEPFDRAAFLAASEQLSVRTQAQRKAFVEAIVDGIADLPPEVRRNIVEAGRGGGPPSRRRGQ